MAGVGEGNGEPSKRPGEKVLKEIRNGFVSVGITKEHGVVIDPVFFNAHEQGTRKREETQLKLVSQAPKYHVCFVGLIFVCPCEKGAIATYSAGGNKIISI